MNHQKPANIEIEILNGGEECEVKYDYGNGYWRCVIDSLDIFNYRNDGYEFSFWCSTLEKSEVEDYFKDRFESIHYELSEEIKP